MPHNIFIENEDCENEIVHFVYAKDVIDPWHGLCHFRGPFDNQFTIMDGFARLGGFREATLRPLVYQHEGVCRTSEKGRVILGQGGHEFGVVGPAYHLLQEETFAKIVDTALRGEARVRTLGRLDLGKKIFVGCDAGEVSIKDPTGSGYKRVFNHKLVVENSFDGTSSFIKRLTTVDPVCQNTLTLGANVAVATVSLRHTANVERHALQVARDLAETGVLVDQFESVILRMMTLQDVWEDDLFDFARAMFPHAPSDSLQTFVPENILTKRQGLCDAYYTSPGCSDSPPNGFRLYSAATWFNDNVLRDKDWAVTTFGPSAQAFRDRAVAAVLDMVAKAECLS